MNPITRRWLRSAATTVLAVAIAGAAHASTHIGLDRDASLSEHAKSYSRVTLASGGSDAARKTNTATVVVPLEAYDIEIRAFVWQDAWPRGEDLGHDLPRTSVAVDLQDGKEFSIGWGNARTVKNDADLEKGVRVIQIQGWNWLQDKNRTLQLEVYFRIP